VASVEALVIARSIEDRSLEEAIRHGLRPTHFTGEWEKIYEWMLTEYRQSGQTPSERAFLKRYSDVSLPDVSSETMNGLARELMDSYRQREVTDAVADAVALLEKDDIDKATEILHAGLRKATIETSRLRDVDITQTWEERYNRYEEMRTMPNAIRGIPTGFYGLDRITHGLRPQQFIVLAGEPKRGKSLFMLIMAMAAHAHGLRPLFLSFEMSNEEQQARFDALRAHVPYDNILSGNLSNDEMQRIKAHMNLLKNQHEFIMSEDSSRMTTLSAVDGLIQEHKPDVVFIDGMYMMDDEEGEDRGSPQALTNLTRGSKRMAQHNDIPVVGSTQVLPSKLRNSRTREVTSDSLGYTSSWAQDADLLLGVERNPDIDNQSIIRVVEGRTVGANQPVHVKWDWSTMEFEEVHESDDESNPSYD
jgi:replicative DNA helicase